MKRILFLLIIIFALNVNASKKFFYIHGTFSESTPVKIHVLNVYHKTYTMDRGDLCWYESNQTMDQIASDVYTTYVQPKETNSDVILFGHSMGGLVARTMLDKSTNIKGLITAGSANNGSPFFNKITSGEAWGFIADIFTKASDAIVISFYKVSNALRINSRLDGALSRRLNTYESRKTVALSFFQTGFNNLLVPYVNKEYPCLNEMAENSEFINNLNVKYVNVPYLNIYGAEDSWPFIRAIASQKKYTEVRNVNNIDKTFDQTGVDFIYDGLSYVNVITEAHTTLYDIMGLLSPVITRYKTSKELVLQARNNWTKLYRYMEVDMHNDIAKFNGSYQYRIHTWTTTILGVKVTKTRLIPYVLENDGLLPDKNVIIDTSHGVKIINQRVPHLNHQEMGNQPDMHLVMEAMYNRGEYGPEFKK